MQIANTEAPSSNAQPDSKNGSDTSQTAGTRSSKGKIPAILGAKRSEKIARCLIASLMFLDYAHGVNEKLPILIVADDAFLPSYAQAGDAGADLRAAESGVIKAGSRLMVSTGVSIAIPFGFVGLVHPRSGLAAKNGITVLNAPGTVDAGYRGEIKVNLFNSSDQDWSFEVGDRIAQLVFQRFETANFVRVTSLPDSDRGQSGFGSTGVK